MKLPWALQQNGPQAENQDKYVGRQGLKASLTSEASWMCGRRRIIGLGLHGLDLIRFSGGLCNSGTVKVAAE